MSKFSRQLRFSLLFLRTFITKYYLYIFLGLILGFVLFTISVNLRFFWVKKYPAEKIGYVGNYTENTLPPEIEKKISVGLFKLTSDDTPKPVLVDDYKIKNKGKTYWFRLKKNIYWQDGTKFSAKTIYYNFKDVEKKVISDYEVEFTLKEPYGPFLELLSRPLFKNKWLVGLGDYKVVEINKSGKFINELAIEKYKNKSKKEESDIFPDRIKYRFYPQEDALVNGFKLGEVNEARGLTAIYDLDLWPNKKIKKTVNYGSWVGIFFNFRSSILSEKNIRQALFYAIEGFKIEEPKVYSPIGINSWAYTKNIKNYSYSPADAKRLFSKIDEKGRSKIKITLIGVKPYDKYLEQIASSWEKLGIKVKVHRSSVIPQNFDALITAFKVPTDPDQYYFWHSTQRGNFINLNSPKIDKVLEDGRLEYRQKKRKELYADFQKYFLEEAPAALLYYPVSYIIARE